VLYQEQLPSVSLLPWVECVWSGERTTTAADTAVLPDGCLDLVYMRGAGLMAVGAMTVQQRVDLPEGAVLAGIRFQPGMATRFLGIPAGELTDISVPLPGLEDLKAKLDDAKSSGARRSLLLSALSTPDAPPDPIERAIEAMRLERGVTDLDWVAHQAGLSPRQFRRRCLEASGLTPKHLCRVLRFRNARGLAIAASHPDWAGIAIRAGYFDQAHLIRDFREFTGDTPMAVFSNTGAVRAA